MQASQRPSSGQQARVGHDAGNADSHAFFNLLTGPQRLERVEAQLPAHRERKFPPTETLSMFLAQVLSADGSCQQALNDSLVKRVMAGLDPGSSDTGADCKARARLPLARVSSLARETGALVAGEVPGWWLWRGRRVRLVDGPPVTLADTQENQLQYPQPASQKQGLGFPVLRLVVRLCLATGALIDAAMGACQGKGSDEQSLFRDLLDALESGDILLCELVRGGVDGVFEQFGARRGSTNFSLGEGLGVKDHRITLRKPERPEWMSPWEYEQFPATLKVRELKAGGKLLVTTFLDPKETSKREVAALLRRRWHVELDIRNIKTTLGMEQLRCKTPEMVRKALWVYLLADNLIRLLMAQSALLADQIPRQLSFKHSVQIWLAWQQRGAATDDPVAINALLVLIAGPRVGLRPGRIEPRCVKRRPKPFSRLMLPRDAARQPVREHGHPKKQR
jgi:hypothetical protein